MINFQQKQLHLLLLEVDNADQCAEFQHTGSTLYTLIYHCSREVLGGKCCIMLAGCSVLRTGYNQPAQYNSKQKQNMKLEREYSRLVRAGNPIWQLMTSLFLLDPASINFQQKQM